MKSNKIIYYLAMFAIFCVSCSTIENKKRIQTLRFDGGFDYYHYYLCYFKDTQDSTIYLLSDISNKQDLNTILKDTLTVQRYYELELVPIKEGMEVTPLGRTLGLVGDYGEVLISGDSVVGLMYTSPNIIGKSYIKLNRNE